MTILTTNILLAIIVLCIVFLTILWTIALVYLISAIRKVKRIAQAFDDDIVRTRSVLIAIKEKITEKIFGKKK